MRCNLAAGRDATVARCEAGGERDDFAHRYQTAGEGACTDPASEVGSAAPMIIEPFAFRVVVPWTVQNLHSHLHNI